jgi:hypothetical protein
MNTTAREKVAAWLETLGSHDIYDANAMAEDFSKETGEQPCWTVHTAQQTRKAIRERGLGGTLTDTSKPLAYGYEVASALAYKYANQFRSGMVGRGSMFRDCLAALKGAL